MSTDRQEARSCSLKSLDVPEQDSSFSIVDAPHVQIQSFDDAKSTKNEHVTPKNLERKIVGQVHTQQPQPTKYHIKLQHPRDFHLCGSKSSASLHVPSQNLCGSIQKASQQNLYANQYQFTSQNDYNKMYQNNFLCQTQVMGSQTGSLNGAAGGITLEDFTQRQMLALKREKGELSKEKALLAQQVELLNLRVLDYEQRERQARQNSHNVQQVLQHECDNYQRESKQMQAMIETLSENLEMLRDESSQWKEKYSILKKEFTEQSLAFETETTSLQQEIVRLKTLHSKQIHEIQLNEINPLNEKLIITSTKLQRVQDLNSKIQLQKQQLEIKQSKELQQVQQYFDQQKNQHESMTNLHRTETKEFKSKITSLKEEISKLKQQLKTIQIDQMPRQIEINKKQTDDQQHGNSFQPQLRQKTSSRSTTPEQQQPQNLCHIAMLNCQELKCKYCGVSKPWDEFVRHVKQQKSSKCQLKKQVKLKKKSRSVTKVVNLDLQNSSISLETDTDFSLTNNTKNISKTKKSDASIQTRRTSVIGAGQGKIADFCIQDVNTKQETDVLKNQVSELNQVVKLNQTTIADLRQEVYSLVQQLIKVQEQNQFVKQKKVSASCEMKTLYNTPTAREEGFQSSKSWLVDLVQNEQPHENMKLIRNSNFAPALHSRHQQNSMLI